MANLGYIGLGATGGRTADRLLSKGHTVIGHNRTRSKAQWLLDKGMADTNAALNAVAEGPDGLLAGLSPGKTVVETSTVSPAASRSLAEQVRARGAEMVDCPVSGSVSTVKAGNCAVLFHVLARLSGVPA
jgi:3-hydroxyisobutyrate dehydrogenase-like beta-hydroxyacid dehydrogenase